jgi:hypothetical protein
MIIHLGLMDPDPGMPSLVRSSVGDPEWFFSDPDPTFQLVSDLDPVSDPK